MRLADVLDPRDDDSTTVAVYTTTEEVTRAELRTRAEALASVLRDAGLQAGQPVGVMLPNGADIDPVVIHGSASQPGKKTSAGPAAAPPAEIVLRSTEATIQA